MEEWVDQLLTDLNPAQKEAVIHDTGPLMIIAGAGTGKTTVITRRIAWLIGQGKATPESILALTFTDKAAGEMEERVDRLLPMGYVDVQISTFHSFCEKILRAQAMHIGLAPDFTLLTETDAWLLMRRNLDRFNLEYFRPRGSPSKFLKSMLQHFSRCKDEGIFPAQYSARVEEMWTEKAGGAPEAFAAMSDEDKLELKKWRELAGAYAMYEQLLVEKSSIDFGGLLLYVLELFQKRPNVLREYREKFSHVIVDEFQDTNSIQYKIVKLLAEPKRNITIVGDDDQAIYKFRGAALANILQFRSDYPETARVVLTDNYRSGKNVLDTAYKLISQNNPHRLEVTEGISKALAGHHEHEGFVTHIHAETLDDEVAAAVEQIVSKVEKGEAAWGDFCILARSNDSVEPFLESFERFGIPYRFAALSGLYAKPVILDTLAFMRAALDPLNSPALYRIVTHPRLGLTERDTLELMAYVRRKAVTMYDAIRRVSEAVGVSMEGRGRLMDIVALLDRLGRETKRKSATEFFVETLKQSGLLADIKFLDEPAQQEIFRHLEGFLARLKRYVEANPDRKQIRDFLEEFDAEREAGEEGGLKGDAEAGPDVVQVMTVHAAKGLEFRYVFIVNLVEQRFPSVSRSEALPLPPGLVQSVPELDDHVAEERRLFYVAMTRAKEGLYLLSAENYGGTRTRKPSRFLVELGFVEAKEKPKGKKEKGEIGSEKKVKATKGSDLIREYIPKQISFSQIAAFSTCPSQYRYAHILRIPTFGRHQLSFGQSMHGTLQRYLEVLVMRQ